MDDETKAFCYFLAFLLFVALNEIFLVPRTEGPKTVDPLCAWAIAKVEHIEGVTDPLRESE